MVVNPFIRLLHFYRRHGWQATAERCGGTLRRMAHLRQMVLFSCALPCHQGHHEIKERVERVQSATLSRADFEQLVESAAPALRAAQLRERFALGSELWLVRRDQSLAGYGWSLRGGTVEPHFFPVRPDEAHLFDFHVFSRFRGEGVNVDLIMTILARLADENIRAVHLECAAWNASQLRSLSKTPLRSYAQASKFRLFGQTIVAWGERTGRNHVLQ